MQQGKATNVGVRLLEYVDAGMSRCLLAPRVCALIEMNGKSAYRLGEDAYTRPHCREVESALLGYILSCCGIGNGVGEKSLVYSRLKLLG